MQHAQLAVCVTLIVKTISCTLYKCNRGSITSHHSVIYTQYWIILCGTTCDVAYRTGGGGVQGLRKLHSKNRLTHPNRFKWLNNCLDPYLQKSYLRHCCVLLLYMLLLHVPGSVTDFDLCQPLTLKLVVRPYSMIKILSAKQSV